MGPAPSSDLDRITARLDALVRAFESHPDTQVQGEVLELLALVAALHRAGLKRLAESLLPSRSRSTAAEPGPA